MKSRAFLFTFVGLMILSSHLAGFQKNKTPELICGGLNIGFNSQNQPLLITGENAALVISKHRGAISKIAGETEIIVQPDSTMKNTGDYINALVSKILPVIKEVYGSPFLSATVKVTYDSTKFPWFFYNPGDAIITVSALPGKVPGFKGSFQYDEDGDGSIDEDPFDGIDNDNDGNVDEDLDADPAWDGVFTHELIHAFHTGIAVLGLPWLEEGMTECASQMVMLILEEEKVRLLSRAHPQNTLLFYDTWNNLHKEIVGGSGPTAKLIPGMWYDGVSALFWNIIISQSENVLPGNWRDLHYLNKLNEALLNLAVEWSGFLWPGEALKVIYKQTPKLIDGINAEQWLRKQNVTYTSEHQGKYLGIFPNRNTFLGEKYPAITNPEILNIIGVQKGNLECNSESPIVSSSPLEIRIYNCYDEIVWTSDGLNAALSDSSGVNKFEIGQTQLWDKGAYRVETKVMLGGLDTLKAQNFFLVTGQMSTPDDIFNNAKDGIGVIIQSPFEANVDSIITSVEDSLVWNEMGGVVIQCDNLLLNGISIKIRRGDIPQVFSLPNPFTRIVMSESPASQFENLLAGFPVILSPDVLEWVNSILVDDVDGEDGKEVVASVGSYSQQCFVLDAGGYAHTGWPIKDVGKIFSCFNLDNEGGNEIMLESFNDSRLLVFGENGKQYPWNFSINPVTSNFMFLDITGDTLPEILVGSNNSLYALSSDGNVLEGFPVIFQDMPSSVVITLEGGDLDSDGKNEIVVVSGIPKGFTEELYISVLNENGTPRGGWTPQKAGLRWLTDVDEKIEVVFPLGDLDNDGLAEIVCAVGETVDRNTIKNGLLKVFHLDGTMMNGFPKRFEDAEQMHIVLANLTNDKYLEIVVGAWYGAYFYDLVAFDAQGNILPKWPQIRIEGRFTGLIAGDIDGDKKPEIISTGNGIFLWNSDGSRVPGSPYTQSNGWEGFYPLFSNPILTDLNADGKTNLIATSNEGVYAWDMRAAYRDSLMDWPMLRHNNNNASYYGKVRYTPDFVVNNIHLPAYQLYQNYPNPVNPSTKIRYEIPTESKVLIKVYDILGREVITLVNDYKKPGRYEVEWNAGKFASGVYFYSIIAGDFYSTKKLILLK